MTVMILIATRYTYEFVLGPICVLGLILGGGLTVVGSLSRKTYVSNLGTVILLLAMLFGFWVVYLDTH